MRSSFSVIIKPPDSSVVGPLQTWCPGHPSSDKSKIKLWEKRSHFLSSRAFIRTRSNIFLSATESLRWGLYFTIIFHQISFTFSPQLWRSSPSQKEESSSSESLEMYVAVALATFFYASFHQWIPILLERGCSCTRTALTLAIGPLGNKKKLRYTAAPQPPNSIWGMNYSSEYYLTTTCKAAI